MKKEYILLVVFFIVALTAAGATYQFVVKVRLASLGKLQEEQAALETKLTSLDLTFEGTKPEVIIDLYKATVQPWSDAITKRTAYFHLGNLKKHFLVPEGEIPKFYYKEMLPAMMDELEDYAWDHDCSMPSNLKFDNPTLNEIGGTNPKAEEVTEWLAAYSYGKSITEMLIDGGCERIDRLELWPIHTVVQGQGGTVERRVFGAEIVISMKELIRMIADWEKADRYMSVENIRITNTALMDYREPLRVELILSQAEYVHKTALIGTAGGVPATIDLSSLSGLKSAENTEKLKNLANQYKSSYQQPGWWENFRRKWIPF